MKTLWIAAVGALALACGGSSDPTPPTCNPGEVRVTGNVDSTQVVHQVSSDSNVFVNAVNNQDGELAVSTSSGGAEHKLVDFKFHDLLIDGQEVSARGFVDLTLQSGPNVGNCETGDYVSSISMDKDGNGGTFVLRSMHDSPYCSGAEHKGALAGCFRF